MTTRFCRCKHCNILYAYHPSGHCSQYNDDIYCNDCQKIISKALESIPVKKRFVYLPAIAGTEKTPVTLEEVKCLRESMLFKTQKVIYSSNMRILCCPDIRGNHYELWVNTDTSEEVLAIEYEEDIETNEISDIGSGYKWPQVAVDEARRKRKEFWGKQRTPSFEVESISPMALPENTILYSKLSYTSAVSEEK